MPDQGLSLEDIVEDLSAILEAIDQPQSSGEPAVYDTIQKSLSGQLQLHILSYIRFLEERAFVVYDRISDQLTLSEAGYDALDAPESWREDAAEAFAEHIPEEDLDAPGLDQADSDPDDNLFEQIASGIDEISAELEADSLDVAADSVFDGPGPVTGRAQALPEAPGVAPDAPSPDDAPARVEPPAASAPQIPNDDRPTQRRDAMNGEGNQAKSTQGDPATHASPAGLYERVSELGVGGVGTVYRATQTRLKRDVALKEVNQVFNVFAGIKRDDIIASFTEVVQRQASLVHPNIVQVLDIETETEFPYVVTQFAPRGNLRRLIEMPERPALGVALKYFMQILSALSTAHDNGIIHGNIKPENVVLDAAGNAMLSDFGMANVVEREGANTAHVYVGVGTVAYMSPEQFQNPNSATVRSDIYSLGIMFYEMLTGKVPGRRSPMPSSFYPDIPRSLDDIFDKMSVDAQEDRYAGVDQILQDLYASEDCMALLDNRSGVLFMRDPIEFGELGGIAAVSAGGGGSAHQDIDEDAFSDEVFGDESSVSELSEESDSDFDEDSDAEEIDEDIQADDVLGKLDKYGDMFEEEEEEE